MECWLSGRGLPCCGSIDMYLIKLPDVRQNTEYRCGAACIFSVCDYWGKQRPAKSLCNHIQGMAPETIEAVLRDCGLQVFRGDLFVELLQPLTKSGVPILCPIEKDGEGHWVVVVGATRSRVFFHDPEDGQRSLPREEWDNAWKCWSEAGQAYHRWGVAAHSQ